MKRVILTLLLVASAGSAFAQTTATAATATAGTTTTTATMTATTTTTTTAEPDGPRLGENTRAELTELLNRSPRELPMVLALDPGLITNDQFLAAHPELAAFVAAHPEVKLQPTFYLADVAGYVHRPDSMLEPFMAFSAFLVVAYALAWGIRTVAEQRRWSRLAQTQSEAHNKILDRFGSSGELLEYMKTTAGAKFLESAPIQLDVDRGVQNPSLARVIGSIQIGVILAAGAAGALGVSGRYADDTGRALFALGVIGLCVGAGFVLSGFVSMYFSRRFAAQDADQVR